MKEGLTAVKAHDLLGRRGIVVPERTLHRYALEVLGVGRSARGTTVRVADGEPAFPTDAIRELLGAEAS